MLLFYQNMGGVMERLRKVNNCKNYSNHMYSKKRKYQRKEISNNYNILYTYSILYYIIYIYYILCT